ncbi:hypothetical protein MGWOODY_XGa2467 [hydrothermal vent metagenome]|uniref:Uncharacterized protein n=1 Tax=hydrothermal vent metagenome TaxID=652676 RepID=A0A160TVN3_9ZZZZ
MTVAKPNAGRNARMLLHPAASLADSPPPPSTANILQRFNP